MNLLLILFFPIIGAVLSLLVKSYAKYTALITSIITFLATVLILNSFNPDATRQFIVNYPWIPQFGINFFLGLDGINIIFVLLTNLLIPIIISASLSRSFANSASLYALVLFMQFGLLLVFLSMDAFLFYIGWEVALIPIYFICTIWGGENKISVNLKFFLYTFLGSLFMLVGIIYLHLQTPDNGYSLDSFYALKLDATTQGWLFWCFFIAFAIKMPIFPFHTWQPDTYTTAPTIGSMLLSGIMLKMGIYGTIRWLIPTLPIGFSEWQQLAIILSIIGIVYASLIAFVQKDIKRLIAYSSIAHVGLISAGIFAFNLQGLQGTMIQILSHGVNVIGLFFIADIIFNRTSTNAIFSLGGIAKVAPKFAILFLIVLLGTVALPLTNGFIGEFLLLNSIYNYGVWYAVFAGLTIIFGAVYMLRMYKHTMQGTTNEVTLNFKDISGSEYITLLILASIIIVLGIFPQLILHLSEASVQNLIDTVNAKF